MFKAFHFKFMKKILFLIVLIASCFLADSQTQTLGSPKGKVQVLGQLQADSLFFSPLRTDTTFAPGRAGAIIYRTADNKLYLYDGSFWRGFINSLDTTNKWIPKGSNYVISVNGQGGFVSVGKADTLKGLPVDTTNHFNNYVLGFDSVNHKWKLSAGGSGGASVGGANGLKLSGGNIILGGDIVLNNTKIKGGNFPVEINAGDTTITTAELDRLRVTPTGIFLQSNRPDGTANTLTFTSTQVDLNTFDNIGRRTDINMQGGTLSLRGDDSLIFTGVKSISSSSDLMLTIDSITKKISRRPITGGGGGTGTDTASVGIKGIIIVRAGNVLTYLVDTSYLTNNWLNNHPYSLTVDTVNGLRVRSGVSGDTLYLSYNGSGGASYNFKTVAAMVAAAPLPDSTIINVPNYYNATPADNVKTEWIYLATSTATVNGMTVLGTTGRFKLIIRDNKTTLKKLGIFPSADNTTQIQAAINLLAGVAKVSVDVNSTFRAKTLSLPSYTYLTAEDTATSIIKIIDYTGVSQSILGWAGTSGTISTGVTVDGIHFEGSVKYAVDTVAAGTTANDSTGVFMSFYYTKNWTIKNCHFKNGGNGGAIFFSNAINTSVNRCSFDSIGGPIIFCYYDPASTGTYFGYNIIHHYGLRHYYDVTSNTGIPWRNGEVVGQFGSSDCVVEYNDAYNDALNRWFMFESRHTGYARYSHNRYHSFGINSGGYSIGGGFGNGLAQLTIDYNEDVDINADLHAYTRKDSFPRIGTPVGLLYSEGNYGEHGGLTFFKCVNNIRNGFFMTLGNITKNALVADNFIDNSNISGSALFGVGLHNDATDTSRDLTFQNNKIKLGPGCRYMKVYADQPVYNLLMNDQVTYTDNSNANASILASDGKTQPPITLYGTYAGYIGFRAISTEVNQVIDASKANFSLMPTVTSDTSNGSILISSNGAKPLIVRDGTIFAASPYLFHDIKSTATSVTATYTIKGDDQIVKADATSGAFTTTLPTAVGVTGKLYTIKRTNSGSNAVTVGTTSSQTIDGSTTYTLANQYDAITVYSDGSNWQSTSRTGVQSIPAATTSVRGGVKVDGITTIMSGDTIKATTSFSAVIDSLGPKPLQILTAASTTKWPWNGRTASLTADRILTLQVDSLTSGRVYNVQIEVLEDSVGGWVPTLPGSARSVVWQINPFQKNVLHGYYNGTSWEWESMFQGLWSFDSTTTSYDVDAQAYFTAAGITDAGEKSAYNAFVIGLKSDGAWTPIRAFYPYLGGSLTTASYNAKDPTKYQITWTGTPTLGSLGMQFNQSSQYGNTNFNPSTQSTSSAGAMLGFYGETNAAGVDWTMGAGLTISGGQLYISPNGGDGNAYCASGAGDLTISGALNKTKLHLAGRPPTGVGADLAYYRDGTDVSGGPTNTFVNFPNYNLFVGATNGTTILYSGITVGCSIITDGLSSAQATSIKNRVGTLMTALSR